MEIVAVESMLHSEATVDDPVLSRYGPRPCEAMLLRPRYAISGTDMCSVVLSPSLCYLRYQGWVWNYAFATRCPVLRRAMLLPGAPLGVVPTPGMVLRTRYAMPVTEIGYAATRPARTRP
eukprot:3549946-Rhodomonas_salina.2